MKRIIGLVIAITGVFGVVLTSAVPVHAASTCDDATFLGFPRWDRNLPKKAAPDCSIDLPAGSKPLQYVWVIVLNITDIMLRLAGIVTVIFIIYGGFRYMTSAGDPQRAKNAQDTILKAVVGLVIAVAAAAAVGFISGRVK